jgi:periplasmic divalent cation tolerance protein
VPEALLVLTSLPNADIAKLLAKDLVEARLAACVNVMAPCHSVYRWEGELQEDGEVPLIIKTTAKLYPAVESYIRQQHPYDLPEIIAVKVEAGSPDYLRWVADSTEPTVSTPD